MLLISIPLESSIESYLKSQVKIVGGLCYKFQSSVIGVPDQIIIYNGFIYLVEVKRPKGKLRDSQVQVHKNIAARGVRVIVVSTYDEVDSFIRDTLNVNVYELSNDKGGDTQEIISKDMFDV